MKKLIKIGLPVLAAFPIVVFAQGRITYLLIDAKFIIRTLITIAVAVALLAFFWGLARFIFKVGGDEKAVEQGKALMKWGLIALFVIVSVWGIISFFQGELLSGVDFSDPNIPSFRN